MKLLLIFIFVCFFLLLLYLVSNSLSLKPIHIGIPSVSHGADHQVGRPGRQHRRITSFRLPSTHFKTADLVKTHARETKTQIQWWELGVNVPELKAVIDIRRVYLALSTLMLTPGVIVQTVALQNDQAEKDKMGRACSTHREKRKEYRISVEKPEGKRLFGRPTYRRQDIVKKNLKVGCLHPVACTRSGSGFPSNATLVKKNVRKI
jgi:hypothetical protein